MKNWTVLLLIFLSYSSFAQSYIKKYEPEQVLFLSNKYQIVVNDSLIRDTLRMDDYSDFGNRSTLKESRFSHKEKIQLTSGQVIWADLRMEGSLYFEEYLSTDTSKVICEGWLQADPDNFKVRKAKYNNRVGKDSMVVDTLYSFFRASVWKIHTGPNTYALVDHGMSKELNAQIDYYTDEIFSPLLRKEVFYQSGAVVKQGQFDFSQDPDKIQHYLMGDWIIRSFNEDQKKIHDENGLIHLMKVTETIKIRPASQYVKILEKNQMETNSSYFEGTDQLKNWKIEQGNKLLINGKTVVVEYVSDKEMVLKVK